MEIDEMPQEVLAIPVFSPGTLAWGLQAKGSEFL